MFQRNLLYTGVTQAKKVCVLIGEKKAIWYAIRNVNTAKRNTMLSERIVTAIEELKVQKEEANEAGLADWNGERNVNAAFFRLSRSKFRSRFFLSAMDKEYVREKGMEAMRRHALNIINKRLVPAEIANDGRQTPMKGHPVFVAQHATATCCRECLLKWHGIGKGRALTGEEKGYVRDVIVAWIDREMGERLFKRGCENHDCSWNIGVAVTTEYTYSYRFFAQSISSNSSIVPPTEVA